MKIQPDMRKHETDLKQLRAERHSEDKRLTLLKARLQRQLSREQPILFAIHSNDRVNVA